MISNHPPKVWLPYLVAAIGALVSFTIWVILTHDIIISQTTPLAAYHPLALFVLGISITFIIAIVIKTAQLEHQRSILIKRMNDTLNKEIAERTNVGETKQKLEAALLQGQKLQAMGTLAGGIAHDFNNILYAIIGYGEMARDDVEKDSSSFNKLNKILEAAHRGQELIGRILAFSRHQHHHFTVINLKAAIDTALSLLRSTIPASVMIELSPVDVSILGNQTQIHQVLVNIINNAVDAMESEGLITIVMSIVMADDPYLKRFPDLTERNYCKIDIADTGHGIDQQSLERIFEPFFTTKEVGKGTGLGLSIVHTIIKDHQGEISVVSQLEQGSIFTLLLPVYSK